SSNNQLTQLDFNRVFGQLVGHKDTGPKLWHSGSIHRTTHKTLSDPEGLRDFIRLVKAHSNEPVELAFHELSNELNIRKRQKRIPGIGENILTEMLMTFKPSKFANLNNNPLTVLEMAGADFP